MSDRIFIRGIMVHAYHGVFEEENRLGQKFTFDIDYWVDTRACAKGDEYARAVSYTDVHDAVVEVAKGPVIKLIETLAERIAENLLTKFPTIEQTRVVVHKPGAPITGVFSDVGVDILRRRDDA